MSYGAAQPGRIRADGVVCRKWDARMVIAVNRTCVTRPCSKQHYIQAGIVVRREGTCNRSIRYKIEAVLCCALNHEGLSRQAVQFRVSWTLKSNPTPGAVGMLGPIHRTTTAIAGNILKSYRLTRQARLPHSAWINRRPAPEHRRLVNNVYRNGDAGIRHCLHCILSCLPAVSPV